MPCGQLVGVADAEGMAPSFWETFKGMAKSPAPTPARPVTLTETERFTLARLESAVEAGVSAVEAVLDAGRSLAEIKSRQLYRDTAATWEEYVRQRFNLSRRRADQLVGFATVKAALEETGTAVPELSERAIRPLVGMDAGTVAEVVAEAAGTAEGVTAGTIRKAAARRRPGKAKARRPVRFKVPGAVVIVQWNRKASGTTAAALAAALRQAGDEEAEAAA